MRLPLIALLVAAHLAALAPAQSAAQSAEDDAFKSRFEVLRTLLLEKGKDYPAPVRVLEEAMADDGEQRVSLLRALIKDRRDAVRVPALRGLAALGPKAAAAAPDLVAMLADRSLTAYHKPRRWNRGRRGMMTFGSFPMAFSHGKFVGPLPEAVRSLGKAVVPSLVGALDGGDYLRRRALKVLEALGPTASAAAPRLQAMLAKQRPDKERVLIVYALAEIGEAARAVTPDLVAIFRALPRSIHPRSHIWWFEDSAALAVARALTRFDRSVVNAALDSDDPAVRGMARRALTTHVRRLDFGHGTGPLPPSVVRAYRWRACSLETVGLSHDADIFAYFDALRSPDENVRSVARASLPMPVPGTAQEALGRLEPFLRDPAPLVRVGAVRCLGQFGREERRRASRLAGAALADLDPRVRRAALERLKQLESRPLRAKLLQLVDDPDAEVAAGAIELLCRIRRSDGKPPIAFDRLVAIAGSDRGAPARVEAMRALASFPWRERGRTAPLLVRAVDDPAPEIRERALYSLGAEQLRSTLRELKPRVVARLEDPDPRVRFAAALAIASLGFDGLDAEPAVRRLLDDPNPEVRQAVKDLILNSFDRIREQVERVRPMFADSSRSVRLKAIRDSKSLGELARPQLEAALDDPDALVCRAAAGRLLEMGPEKRLARTYRENSSPRVRAAILETLGMNTTPSPGSLTTRQQARRARARALAEELAPERRAALDSDHAELRRTAVKVECNLAAKPAAVRRLYRLSLDPDPEVSREAFYRLWQLDEPKQDVAGLIRLFEERSLARGLVLRKLGRMGAEARPALPTLWRAFEEGPEARRGSIAHTIASIAGAEAAKDLPSILPLLDSEDAHTRGIAVATIGQIGPAARATKPRLIEIFENDPSRSVRSSALCALGKVTHGTDEAVPLLLGALRVRAFDTTAMSALGDVGPAAKDAIPVLEKLARVGRPYQRSSARAALEKIKPPIPAELRDRTRCVSRRPGAAETANGHCWNPAISADGRIVAFDSDAPHLVGPAPAQPVRHQVTRQVYVHDRETGRLTCVSVSSKGDGGNGSSGYAAVSRDGRRVAFVSSADNLVADDFNEKPDVFVHDRATGQTVCVSVNSAGEKAVARSWRPTFSRDGRRVMFRCEDKHLVPGGEGLVSDVLVHDLETGRTTRASVDAASRANAGEIIGVQVRDADRAVVRTIAVPRGKLPPGGIPLAGALCDRGRQVVFLYEIRFGKIANPTRCTWYLVRHHVERASTEILIGPLDVKSNDTPIYQCVPLSVSDDGRRIVFTGYPAHFVEGDSNEKSDVFVLESKSRRIVRASVDPAGRQANHASHSGSISADGRFVVFISFAANLTPSDGNEAPDVFVRRLD